jgi:hypothetical protein
VLYPQLNQPRLLQKARRYRIASVLARCSSNAPNGATGLPPTLPLLKDLGLNLIERRFELLRNTRIGKAHAADKIEQALKDFIEAIDDTLLTTNPKRLSGPNPRMRS